MSSPELPPAPEPGSSLEIFVIYKHPPGYQTSYVLRRQRITAGHQSMDKFAVICPDLETARLVLPAGLVRLEPDPDDDPTICELWL